MFELFGYIFFALAVTTLFLKPPSFFFEPILSILMFVVLSLAAAACVIINKERVDRCKNRKTEKKEGEN